MESLLLSEDHGACDWDTFCGWQGRRRLKEDIQKSMSMNQVWKHLKLLVAVILNFDPLSFDQNTKILLLKSHKKHKQTKIPAFVPREFNPKNFYMMWVLDYFSCGKLRPSYSNGYLKHARFGFANETKAY